MTGSASNITSIPRPVSLVKTWPLYQYEDQVFAPCGSLCAISTGFSRSVKSKTVVPPEYAADTPTYRPSTGSTLKLCMVHRALSPWTREIL